MGGVLIWLFSILIIVGVIAGTQLIGRSRKLSVCADLRPMRLLKNVVVRHEKPNVDILRPSLEVVNDPFRNRVWPGCKENGMGNSGRDHFWVSFMEFGPVWFASSWGCPDSERALYNSIKSRSFTFINEGTFDSSRCIRHRFAAEIASHVDPSPLFLLEILNGGVQHSSTLPIAGLHRFLTLTQISSQGPSILTQGSIQSILTLLILKFQGGLYFLRGVNDFIRLLGAGVHFPP